MEAQNRGLVDDLGQPLDLVLYKFDGCYFCHIVMDYLQSEGLQIALKDTREEPNARKELVRVGGKSQVPCLFVNGRPMYESRDIIAFLRSKVA
jgi:glutaredoxin